MVFELRQAGQSEAAANDRPRDGHLPGPPMWLSVALARTVSLLFLALVIFVVSHWI